jgi:hypothetical protein
MFIRNSMITSDGSHLTFRRCQGQQASCNFVKEMNTGLDVDVLVSR